MSIAFYKTLHLIALMTVFFALGQMTVAKDKSFKLPYILHGAGMLLVLVAGFGLLAKLQIKFDSWAVTKLLTWVAVAAVPSIIKRSKLSKAALSFVIIFFAVVGVVTALNRY